MNTKVLREKDTAELNSEMLELRRELFNLRMQKGTGQLGRPSEFKRVKRGIARIKTIVNERKAEQAS